LKGDRERILGIKRKGAGGEALCSTKASVVKFRQRDRGED